MSYYKKEVSGPGAIISHSGAVFTISFTGGPSYLFTFGTRNGNATLKASTGTITGTNTIVYFVKTFE